MALSWYSHRKVRRSCLHRGSDDRGPRAGQQGARAVPPHEGGAPRRRVRDSRSERKGSTRWVPSRRARGSRPRRRLRPRQGSLTAPLRAALPGPARRRGEVSVPLPSQRRRGRAGVPLGGTGRGRPAPVRLPGSLHRDQVAAVPASASPGGDRAPSAAARAPERSSEELTAGLCRRGGWGEGSRDPLRRREARGRRVRRSGAPYLAEHPAELNRQSELGLGVLLGAGGVPALVVRHGDSSRSHCWAGKSRAAPAHSSLSVSCRTDGNGRQRLYLSGTAPRPPAAERPREAEARAVPSEQLLGPGPWQRPQHRGGEGRRSERTSACRALHSQRCHRRRRCRRRHLTRGGGARSATIYPFHPCPGPAGRAARCTPGAVVSPEESEAEAAHGMLGVVVRPAGGPTPARSWPPSLSRLSRSAGFVLW